MRIEDSFRVSNWYVAQEAMPPQRAPTVQDLNIDDLIAQLAANGIEIDPAASEQDVSYTILGRRKQATVPLKTQFEIPVSIQGYALRNRRLEILVEDYHRCSGLAQGVIGGRAYCEDGIRCTVRLEGRDVELVETVKEVLMNSYAATE